MSTPPKRELPGDVVIALRTSEGFTKSSRPFATTVHVSYDTMRRWEMVKWGTIKEDWVRPFDREDLELLVNAKWLEKGDGWWLRFKTAFAWQHVVMEYGRRVYEKGISSERLLEPVSQEHAIVLIRTLVQREVQRSLDQGISISPPRVELMTEKVTAEVLFRLTTTDLILVQQTSGRITPESEQTRGVQALLSAQGGQPDTPYVRALRLGYEWTEEALVDALADETSITQS